jgi:hypothetical protein
LRGTEGEREEKGKEFIKKVRKGRIKNNSFFLIARKSSQKKKKKKENKKLLGVPWHPQPLTWLRHWGHPFLCCGCRELSLHNKCGLLRQPINYGSVEMLGFMKDFSLILMN